ncbi:hypothetical protein EJA06_002480 [Pseudomonas songnenensis]|uniref:Uncharacterized protein n=1 Tax=Pseudomonas songnenensis TaxID=1176259 RepID=A0A482UKD0_9PSED|nr:hypothetical protein [Pseudomonas songnenensis]RYJ64130.1 hypothetical protein EJA06_002480 [Pseudomonas songnenensis]
MPIHHLNCGCMCPHGGALFDDFSQGQAAPLACLSPEHRDGVTRCGGHDARELARLQGWAH